MQYVPPGMMEKVVRKGNGVILRPIFLGILRDFFPHKNYKVKKICELIWKSVHLFSLKKDH